MLGYILTCTCDHFHHLFSNSVHRDYLNIVSTGRVSIKLFRYLSPLRYHQLLIEHVT